MTETCSIDVLITIGAIVLAWWVINFLNLKAEAKYQYQKGYRDGVKAEQQVNQNRWGR